MMVLGGAIGGGASAAERPEQPGGAMGGDASAAELADAAAVTGGRPAHDMQDDGPARGGDGPSRSTTDGSDHQTTDDVGDETTDDLGHETTDHCGQPPFSSMRDVWAGSTALVVAWTALLLQPLLGIVIVVGLAAIAAGVVRRWHTRRTSP